MMRNQTGVAVCDASGEHCRALEAAEAKLVAEQEKLARSVREAVLAADARSVRGDGRAGLAALRSEYAEAGEDDRIALLAQMHDEAARADARREAALPDLGAPYFAHMRVRTAGRARDVLVGVRPFVDSVSGIAVVDYRRAPIAEVFFSCDEGDEYEIDVDGRTVTGVLERRHLVTFERGDLAAMTVPGGALQRVEGAWQFAPGALVPTFSRAEHQGLAAEIVERGQSIASLLDREQTALLERDPKETLLVLGSAGSGKTTVAIHRIASIARREPRRFDPAKVMVVVPEVGLRRLSERMLADLGLEAVAVRTFDDWVRAEAERVFPWIPPESPDAPVGVRRLKRHPALFAAIDVLIDELTGEMAARIDRLHAGRGAFESRIAARTEPILADRLRLAEEDVLASAPPAKKPLLADAFREERKRLERVQADHQRLVGDRALLMHAWKRAAGDLPEPVLGQAAEHTRRQLDEPSAVRFAHVDADRLQTLDGRELDEDTPDAVAGTIDLEDHALLFELLWRKTGQSRTRRGTLSRYQHLVIDEAQELSPIELRLLGRALGKGTATVAGDAAQRIDADGYFASWDSVVSALGVQTTPSYLETSYRCPRPILELAHAVLGPEAVGPMPTAAREGPPVLRSILPGVGHAAAFIAEGLRELSRREPRAGVAIIAHDAATARAIHDFVQRALPTRLVLDGDFSFAPGVEITEVAQVKGLEFDYIIVPDADARSYPDTPEHRRMLYVALTRALHQVWLVSPGAASPLL